MPSGTRSVQRRARHPQMMTDPNPPRTRHLRDSNTDPGLSTPRPWGNASSLCLLPSPLKTHRSPGGSEVYAGSKNPLEIIPPSLFTKHRQESHDLAPSYKKMIADQHVCYSSDMGIPGAMMTSKLHHGALVEGGDGDKGERSRLNGRTPISLAGGKTAASFVMHKCIFVG